MQTHADPRRDGRIPALRSKPQRGGTTWPAPVLHELQRGNGPSTFAIVLRGFVIGISGWAIALFAMSFAAGN